MAAVSFARRRPGRLQWAVFFLISMVGLYIVLYITGEASHMKRPRPEAPNWVIPASDLATPTNTMSDDESALYGQWTFLGDKANTDTCTNCESSDLATATRRATKELESLGLKTSRLTAKIQRMTKVLHVISRGAKRVMLTSHLSTLAPSFKRLNVESQAFGVRGMEYYQPELTLDSFHFTHQSKISSGNPCLYRISKSLRPIVSVGVRCRATAVSTNDPPFWIDPHAPPVFISSPLVGVVDFSDAFFEYDGLWAMFLSFVTRGEAAEVWGVWAQRLIQELGANLALSSLSCPKTVVPEATSGQPSLNTQRTLDQVRGWSCSVETPFSQCAMLLAELIRRYGFVDQDDMIMLRYWFDQLRDLGYAEPQRVPPRIQEIFTGCIIHSPAPVQEKSVSPRKLFPDIEPNCNNTALQQSALNPLKPYSITSASKVSDIALVVIFFNASIYHNIKYLDNLHRNHFPYLIYCGPSEQTFQATYRQLNRPLTYLEVRATQGFVAYECITRAMMMNYDVNGYLEMADDVLLNSWNLGPLPRDRFWFQKELHVANRKSKVILDFAIDRPVPWWPWKRDKYMWGRNAMSKVWKIFVNIQRSKDEKGRELVNLFLLNLRMNSGHPDYFYYASSDIFYVPALHRQTWSILGEIFMNNNVFLDIAVPTLIHGMDLARNVLRLDGEYVWYKERAKYPKHYKPSDQFFHPWKIGWVSKPNTKHSDFLCTKVLPHLVNDLMV